MYRITQRHRLDFMTLKQFVQVVETLGKLRLAEAVHDKHALQVLFQEFVRPSIAKHFTTDEIPTVSELIHSRYIYSIIHLQSV